MAHLHLQGFTLAGPLAKGSALPSTQLPLQVPPRLLFQAGFCDLSGSPMTWASLLPLPSPQHMFGAICWPTKWPESASGQGGVPSHWKNPSPTSPYPSLDWTTSKPTTAMEGGRGLPQRENEKPGPQPLPHPWWAATTSDSAGPLLPTCLVPPSPPHTMSRDGPWEEGAREELK